MNTERRFRIVAVAGARPNFMKIAPSLRELEARPAASTCFLVHTGQHYDEAMSERLLRASSASRVPDVNLESRLRFATRQ